MTGIPENNDPRVADSWNRFVVLRHDVGPCFERTTETHLDWMFATGDALATWSTELITDFKKSVEMPCQKLPDHRLVYLDREGDLGGGRGSVRRVLAGEYMLLTSALAEVTFKSSIALEKRVFGSPWAARVRSTAGRKRFRHRTDIGIAFINVSISDKLMDRALRFVTVLCFCPGMARKDNGSIDHLD